MKDLFMILFYGDADTVCFSVVGNRVIFCKFATVLALLRNRTCHLFLFNYVCQLLLRNHGRGYRKSLLASQ